MTEALLLSNTPPAIAHKPHPIAVHCAAFLKRSAKIIHIVAVETFANFRHVLPAAVKWVGRKYIYKEIRTFVIRADKTNRVAYLNLHGRLPNHNENARPVLLCHGDYGHPFTTLHLAEIAQKERVVTFSLYVPGTEKAQESANNNEFFKLAVDKIQDLVRESNGIFSGVLGAGHSRGAIFLAERQFVNLDERHLATFAVGGRLSVPDEKECPEPILAGKLKNIHAGIINNPAKPVVQIIPINDYNSSRESMAVRPHDHCYNVPGMHLSGLFEKATRNYFTQFIREYGR
jgi:hypothetical protein